MRKVAIFWDFDNTYWTIIKHYGQQEELNPSFKLIEEINKLYEQDQMRIFRAYADFEKIRNVQSEIQKRKVTPKHVFSSNAGADNRKNAGDIELSLDALETAIKSEEINHFVIITADKDMIPLIHRLSFYGKEVHLIYLEAALAEDKLILNFPSEHSSIEALIGLDNSKVRELDSAGLENGIQDAKEIIQNFYDRNAEKPHLFLGKPIFISDMTAKKRYSGKHAEEILNYGLEQGYFYTESLSNKKEAIHITQNPVNS